MSDATFLHLTDAHLTGAGTPLKMDDIGVDVPGISHETREEALDLMLARLADRLARDGLGLAGVLFSGDAQDRGMPGGHERTLEMILHRLGPCGITSANVVATPGNHDVPRGTDPGSPERYAPFRDVWQAAGCIVPWLDGIDRLPPSADAHRLMAPDGRWAVYPLNTSNWSHVTAVLPEPLRSAWERIPTVMSGGDTLSEGKLRSQLEALVRYDMTRVSRQQLEALRAVIATTPQPDEGPQLRMVLMHHHLRPPSLREQVRPFAEMSNTEQVRAFFRDNCVSVAAHGHKHERSIRFEPLEDQEGRAAGRVLVISGGTFSATEQSEAARLVTLGGLPHVPTVSVESLPLTRGGVDPVRSPPLAVRLWTDERRDYAPVSVSPGSPVVVAGNDLDEVYERACAAAASIVPRGTLVVHLDLPPGGPRRLLPKRYVLPADLDEEGRQEWMSELAGWWQMGRSRLEHRIPYRHGARLRRFGGKIDQVSRIVRLLSRGASTRALAVLVDPFRDFTDDGSGEEIPSFCLVEFMLREGAPNGAWIDAVAFYRAQEFARWWPVNVAELRLLQDEVAMAVGGTPGRITTIAPDARTVSRSPTQVAMPIVDRWLDTSPETIHVLANAIVGRTACGDAQARAMLGWTRALAEMRAATLEYDPDGVPTAVEGLYTLASYVEAAAASDDRSALAFARGLRDLAAANESFEGAGTTPETFRRWSASARRFVDDLSVLTSERLPTPG
ncbi:hypothetical protein VQ03_27480 [Methylobacterium tarhaniae]|uniref:Calcineurin-like phosphoesterase domain-containing protein n=1 Tax=Methylobacterium tarhaniae TaxID=1187852 RepID=A0A0J6SC83_9HYPH|nr:metallophosphoesterase [Methylobacterium tarhaniae]KMO31264.1 hypothetical protein VQ03_27480 [Methylobacterium tarhaniae]